METDARTATLSTVQLATRTPAVKRRRAPMTFDELCGHAKDALALPLSDSQTVQTLLARASGADPKQLLAAVLAVAREQTNQKIFELERALGDSRDECWRLEDRVASLLTKRKRNSPAAMPSPENQV